MTVSNFLLFAFATYFIVTALLREGVFYYDRLTERYLDFKPFNCPFCLSFWVGGTLFVASFFFPIVRILLVPFAIAGFCDLVNSLAKLPKVLEENGGDNATN